MGLRPIPKVKVWASGPYLYLYLGALRLRVNCGWRGTWAMDGDARGCSAPALAAISWLPEAAREVRFIEKPPLDCSIVHTCVGSNYGFG